MIKSTPQEIDNATEIVQVLRIDRYKHVGDWVVTRRLLKVNGEWLAGNECCVMVEQCGLEQSVIDSLPVQVVEPEAIALPEPSCTILYGLKPIEYYEPRNPPRASDSERHSVDTTGKDIAMNDGIFVPLFPPAKRDEFGRRIYEPKRECWAGWDGIGAFTKIVETDEYGNTKTTITRPSGDR